MSTKVVFISQSLAMLGIWQVCLASHKQGTSLQYCLAFPRITRLLIDISGVAEQRAFSSRIRSHKSSTAAPISGGFKVGVVRAAPPFRPLNFLH